MRTFIATIGLCALASACSPELELGDTEVTHACAHADDVPFTGDEVNRAELPIEELELDRLPPEAIVTLSSVELEAAAGIDDFSFVDALRVDLVAPEGLDDLVLVDEAPRSTASPLHLVPRTEADLAGYLREPALVLDVDLSGQMPIRAWSADIALCFELRGAVIGDR